ncbi:MULTISPECIES: Lrp/AsnC family transcriptional regulator [Streptomyces]|uniref:Lrp/AsnC family transcriptional regulator n=1 Tax=Streptomyces sudanensis TaxID=436397 RepID=A0ABY4THE8_9ACTN|nr:MULTISPECIES: Lrp/AsnC family transcriptional regulator [Streptomyces]MCP9956608.1 Lrp/AsnC family transcriptional regulator [Streptomyces sudanensis]MCP9985809.1 Lrp/AsnC family transcriptional regulator [Streptomyces sudanensis]MCQ0002789.1 Lrp/AsnC family transcriptional regulator [Streptomyces sudanensis]URN17549.1 Lrp/AsnC family transcriptional regulator [Streptomyces sudanensis]
MTAKPMPFDELDRKIVATLMANARASFSEIGAAIGLSATAVKRRVDRLRKADVITGFRATVRPSALGWRTEAYIEVYCDNAAPPRRLAEVARKYPEIAAAMTVTGAADALLHVRATDVEHFEEVLERIRSEPFIRKTISYMVLSHLLPDSPEAGASESAPGALPGGAPGGAGNVL